MRNRENSRTPAHVLRAVKQNFESLFKPDGPTESAQPQFDFIPDLVMIHSCLFPEQESCRCRKKVPYVEALEMVKHGEGNWVTINGKTIPALSATVSSRVQYSSVPNAGSAEAAAEIALAEKQQRRPDLSGLFEQAQSIQESAQQNEVKTSGGSSVGGVIQKTTRTRTNDAGTKLVEESTASFELGQHLKMTGKPLQYKSKHLKLRELKPDKTGQEASESDDFGEESDV